MILGGSWWFFRVFVVLLWFLVVLGGFWWFFAVLSGSWQFLVLFFCGILAVLGVFLVLDSSWLFWWFLAVLSDSWW